MKHERGEGRIFQDRYRDRATGEWRTCETWTIRWYSGGRHHKQGGFETEKAARRELRARQEASAQGLYVPGADGTTFENLATLLLDEYRANGRRSLDRADDAVSHLREFFDGYKARARPSVTASTSTPTSGSLPTIAPASSSSAATSSAPRSPRTASSAGPTGASSSS